MPLDALLTHPNHLARRLYLVIATLALSLLTACGGGGGGGNPAAPNLKLVWDNAPSPSSAPIQPGDNVVLKAMPGYEDALIKWTDESGAEQRLPVDKETLNTPLKTFTFNPTKTTTYKLVSNYQGITSDPVTVTVNVTPAVISRTLTASSVNLTPLSNPIVTGTQILLTPTFTCTVGTNPGKITNSVVIDGTTEIKVSSGTAIQVTASQITNTYVLKVSCLGSDDAQTSVTVTSAVSPKFTLGANLGTARSNHIAVLLPNSLVLVAGGSSGSASLKSAELYDPVKNTWTSTGDMNTARVNHSAVLLSNNKVLVTGGFDGTIALKTAEVYDPSTGKWTATTSGMTFSHSFHTSTLLPDNRVLIAGGVLGPANNADATSTEVYSPTTDAFTAGPNLPESRQGHTTTVLKNGKILLVGNSNGNAAKAVVLPDAAPASVAVATGALNFGRYNHAATLLSSGPTPAPTDDMVLVTGGFGSNPKSAEIYKPADNLWYPAGNMNEARAFHTSTLLRNGKVLIIGGYNYTSGTLSTIELFSPTLFSFSTPQASWSTLPKVMNTSRASHTSTLLSNDNILVIGTYLQGGGTATASTEIWAP